MTQHNARVELSLSRAQVEVVIRALTTAGMIYHDMRQVELAFNTRDTVAGQLKDHDESVVLQRRPRERVALKRMPRNPEDTQ